ncbi:MAG: CopG family transcriptional regulator [Thiotrichaceae bacterium IS1]|nr:MAG: CopG family transcriptional regulator [Thiotrichaceae bacterium IS1]
MNTVTLQLPDSLYTKINELVKVEGISIHQFLTLATAEKLTAFLTPSYLEQEAARGQRADFEKVLTAVPQVEPEEYDRL